MPSMEIAELEKDFMSHVGRSQEALWENGNPGRWLGIGRGRAGASDKFFIGYAFGGRSEGSKNRMAIYDGNAVRLISPGMTIEDMDRVPDAALIYYHAMDTKDGVFVVSNGVQTRPVLDAIVDGASFEEAVTNAPVVKGFMNQKEVDIDLSSYEPDSPINTSRITGILDTRQNAVTPFGLAVVHKDPQTSEPVRSFYVGDLDDIHPGQGWAIQTYGVNDPDDKETPVPYFDQPPYGFIGMGVTGETTTGARAIERAVGKRTFAASVVRAVDLGVRQFRGSTIINTRG